jgi:hypothetical protein
MSIIAKLLEPLSFSARRERDDNRACFEANRAQERALLQAERDYWDAFYKRATTQEERWQAIDELERLDAIERAS